MKHTGGKKIYTISEANYFAKQTLEQLILWVEGEVSSLKKHPSMNFYYLDLKDERAVLPCIANGALVENVGEDLVGQNVLAYGNLSLYEPFGKYQFRISHLEKAGEGLLQRRLEELIRKLKTEGLFDQKYKKEIPKYPKKICLVTSVGSDAYNDFKRHTVDEFPIIELYTADVRVQGPKSVPGLLKVLPHVDELGYEIIIITRGGGSLEDLAAFNDEQVARIIFKMKTPTIVAIGHEANESLAEWVADRRGSTPNNAASIVTAGYTSLISTLDNFKYQLRSKSNYYFSTNFQRLDYIFLQLSQEKLKITDARSKIDNLFLDLKRQSQELTRSKSQNLESLARSLLLLSPQNTLSRGYSITTDEKGRIIRDIRDVVIGQIIGVKLSGGSFSSRVLTKKND